MRPSPGAQGEAGLALKPETGAPPESSSKGDLPVAERTERAELTPSVGFVMRLGPTPEAGVSRGTTVRNGPGEAPDQRSLNEYTGEVLTRRLNADLRQEVGLAAIGAGNVPAHFKRYEAALRQALQKSNIDRSPTSVDDTLRGVAGIFFNSGPSVEAANKVADSPLGRSVQRQSVSLPNVEDQRAREQGLQLLSQSENVKEQASRSQLRTVLELTTDPSGALAHVSIVERSGDARFDESVLHFSRKVARSVPDADDKMLGSSMWRTRWQFTWEPPDLRVRLLNAWRVSGTEAPQ